MLVLAGAGTGKTTVLVERIAHLIGKHHAKPGEILALTFSDAAAVEMAERVRQKLSGIDSTGLRATTFHGYCYGLLMRSEVSFRVLTKEDLYIYLRRRLRELPLDCYLPAANPGQFLESLLEFFDRCHDEQVAPADYRAYVQKVWTREAAPPRVSSSKAANALSPEQVLARCQEIASVFRQVEEMLARDGYGTFGHMITRAAQLLREDPEVLRREQAGARFLLIDEFQDVNTAQLELAQQLAGKSQNIFGVGDPDQAIYRFRGASAAAFKEFARRFPETKTVVLKDNQRSRTAVLKCAAGVISNNPVTHFATEGSSSGWEREELVSAREGRARRKGVEVLLLPVEIVVAESDEEEANHLARRIEALCNTSSPGLKDRAGAYPRIGVLYRQHAHRKALVNELAARGIPFTVLGMNALETREVRDLLAGLRVATSLADSGSLFRIAALPMFGLDPVRMREVLANAGRGADFMSVLDNVPDGDEVRVAAEEAWAVARENQFDTIATLEFILDRFRFDAGAPAVVAFRNFIAGWRKKPLVRTGELAEFLEYMDYFPDAGGSIEVAASGDASDPEVVRLMTAHAAKGLEFDHVFVLRMAQGSFPTNFRERLFEFPAELRKGLVPESDDKQIHRQEERRLFYVAMTRARESLTICARPGKGRRHPRPQGFVRELMDNTDGQYWQQGCAGPFAVDLAAAEAAMANQGVGAWMLLPPPDPPRIATLSATAIEYYETCPLKFRIDRDWRIPGQIAAAMHYGNAVHTVLKDYFESLRAGRPKSEEEVAQCLTECLRTMHFDDPYQRELYQRDGGQQLREFVRLCRAQAPNDVIGTERTFEITLGGVPVRGRVDRMDRIEGSRVAVVDYKTGTPRSEKDARDSLQLSIYAIAAREHWGLEPERLVFYNLRDNTEVVATRNEEDLAQAREQVKEVAARITEGHFEPKPGFHCRRCRYWSICPATEERLYTIPTAQAAKVN